MKALSIVGYLGLVAGLVGLLATKSLLSPLPVVIALQLVALMLLIWARFTFGRRSFHVAANPTAGGLVTTGPYRFIRHPIYTAICLFVTAGAAAHLSLSSVLLCTLIWATCLTRMLCEERLLRGMYPEYGKYAAATPRMIPFVF
jgi:protein-S-isoprenylcysteine O-methyltransferase Ste14